MIHFQFFDLNMNFKFMEEHTLPDKKKEIKPRPPLEYPKEDFDLAYVAEDFSEGVSGNSIIVVLS